MTVISYRSDRGRSSYSRSWTRLQQDCFTFRCLCFSLLSFFPGYHSVFADVWMPWLLAWGGLFYPSVLRVLLLSFFPGYLFVFVNVWMPLMLAGVGFTTSITQFPSPFTLLVMVYHRFARRDRAWMDLNYFEFCYCGRLSHSPLLRNFDRSWRLRKDTQKIYQNVRSLCFSSKTWCD